MLPETATQIQQIISRLAERRERFVLAESCTAGLVAAWLGQSPGVSQQWCGSCVTYRDESKIEWLGIDRNLIGKYSSVSVEVTRQMAIQVLLRTPEAHWSAAITGHLGPDAPLLLDGQLFVAIAYRNTAVETCQTELRQESGKRLESMSRQQRQELAAAWLLAELWQALNLAGSFGQT